MSKKKERTDMPDTTPAPATPKRAKVDYASEVSRFRALPNMFGVADKLAEAVADEQAVKEQLRSTRRRMRKMYAGILTVIGEGK